MVQTWHPGSYSYPETSENRAELEKQMDSHRTLSLQLDGARCHLVFLRGTEWEAAAKILLAEAEIARQEKAKLADLLSGISPSPPLLIKVAELLTAAQQEKVEVTARLTGNRTFSTATKFPFSDCNSLGTRKRGSESSCGR